jgi:hypothetical protein
MKNEFVIPKGLGLFLGTAKLLLDPASNCSAGVRSAYPGVTSCTDHVTFRIGPWGVLEMLWRTGRHAKDHERSQVSVSDEGADLPQRLRSSAEIDRQYVASQAFAPEVVDLPPIPHQYSAGQAAALAWLAGHGPAPLTYGATAVMSGPHSVQRTRCWATELMERPDDDLFPRPYVIGVEYVCRWAQRAIDRPPFPVQEKAPLLRRGTPR